MKYGNIIIKKNICFCKHKYYNLFATEIYNQTPLENFVLLFIHFYAGKLLRAFERF